MGARHIGHEAPEPRGGLRLLCVGSGLSGHSGPMEALQGHAFHAQEAEHMTAVKFYWMKQDLQTDSTEAISDILLFAFTSRSRSCPTLHPFKPLASFQEQTNSWCVQLICDCLCA